MPPAIPAVIGAGAGLYSAIKGAQQQGQSLDLEKQQAAQAQQEQQQQDQMRQMVISRILSGPQGATGNPFSSQYGSIQGPGTTIQNPDQSQAISRIPPQMGRFQQGPGGFIVPQPSQYGKVSQ